MFLFFVFDVSRCSGGFLILLKCVVLKLISVLLVFLFDVLPALFVSGASFGEAAGTHLSGF